MTRQHQPDLFDDVVTIVRTLTRPTDPITSREAVASISDKITMVQQLVLDWARKRPEGFTDRQLVTTVLWHSPSTLRTRRSELRDRGLIRHKMGPDGKPLYRIHDGSGRRHIVWEATP